MIWFRALLLALVSLFAPAVWACSDFALRVCDDSSAWATRSQLLADPAICGVSEQLMPDGRTCMGYGFGPVTPPPQPSNCPAAGTEPVAPGQGLNIRILDLSVDPKFGCDTSGCQFEPIWGGVSARYCKADGSCYMGGDGARPKYTGATCDPNGIQTNIVDPPATPKPGDPKDPLSPNLKPIDNPDGIFPGCKNNTDPGCVLEKLPPGCKKTTTTTATGGVNEKTVCEEVTCSPSICKKVSTSDDKSWATGGGFKAGDPPDSQSTKTTETVQTRDGSGSGTGSGTAGGTGTGTNGGSSSISGVGMSDLDGDGYMDGDTDKDGKCDVNCTKKTDQSGESSYCEENPKSSLCEKKDESGCAKDSKGIGCMEPGTAPDEKVGKSEVGLGLKSSPVSFGGGGGCPGPTVVSIGGVAATLIDPGPVCGVLSSVARPIVILIALFAGALIIFRGVEV